MKLDYSKKDRNWQIYTTGNSKPIKPKSMHLTPARLIAGIVIVIIIVALLVIFLVPHGHRPHVAEQHTTPTTAAVKNSATQTVTIPLELPSSPPKTSQE